MKFLIIIIFILILGGCAASNGKSRNIDAGGIYKGTL